ncbi:TonB-linked outer membrane protein, SusC/RagA family [Pedobacter nyackensis]|uniref:TonB-linked outer membrane protein, SusC/RagA family n=2 Tax=Pedobacter nyackensis TaxID=475255 RepID=A0A1W2EI12_9SPHI|nr:TonB-linked outer membrane protein, SusC/RagA family [Pedobacter nyackensis]
MNDVKCLPFESIHNTDLNRFKCMKFYIKSVCRPPAGIAKFLLVINSLKRIDPTVKRQIIMRFNLIIVLLTATILHVSASSYSQSVTLKYKNAALISVFKEIRSQTGYDFFYSDKLMNGAKPVNLNLNNVSLENALKICFADQPLSYSIENKTVIVKHKETSILDKVLGYFSAVDLRGRVLDENGLPLIGVSVKIKGGTGGVSTNSNGEFIIKLPEGSETLIFSYIGYQTKEISVNNNTVLNVTLLEANKGLDEVIVVGYGSQKKRNVIGSVAQINSDDLKQMPTMNITNMLSGRLPGITTLQQSGRPGADDATLRIRGTSSYQGSQGPIAIVDGVERPFAQLDPNEIESISILKDAVALSVYGLQAANGIILVTTKRGKAQQPKISYDGAVMVNSNTRFPKFLDGPDYMEWFSRAEELDNEYRISTDQDPNPLTYNKAQINALRNGTNTNPLFGNTDWVGEFLGKKSTSQSHSVTVRGGTERVKYFSNIGYLDQEGIVANTGFKRFNLRTNLDAQLNSILSVAFDINAQMHKTRTPGISPDNTAYMNPFYQAVRTLPNMPMYAPNGLPTAYNSNAGYVNPIASVMQSGYQHGEANVFQTSLAFNVKVPWVSGLSGKVLTSFDKTGTENKNWLTPYPLMGRGRNQISGNYTLIPSPPGFSVTTLRQNYNQNNRLTFQPSLNYTKTFGSHTFNALALYEWARTKSSLFSTGARNFALTELHDIDFGSSATLDFVSPTGSSRNKARQGYVGRINYAYKNKYLFEAAMRADASISFPEEGRWGYFPGAGLGWIVSEENFFEKIKNTVNFFKIKASHGVLGKEATVTEFAYLPSFAFTENPVAVIGGSPVSALYTGTPPNRDLTWERHRVTNVGFEAELWNGKLGVDFDYFYKVVTDILTTRSGLYPSSVGGNFPSTFNDGITDNRGFDLQIKHRNNLGKFSYAVTGNFNWARNKIILINEVQSLPSWQKRTGRPIGEKLGFVVDGFYQNWDEARNGSSPSSGIIAPGFFKYRDLNGDGRVTRDADMTAVGRSNMPEIMYGLNLEASYSGFDFSVLFQGAGLSSVALGGVYEGSSGTSGIEDNTPFTKTFYGYGNSPYYLVEQAWRPDNQDAKFPRLTSGGVALSPHNANANSGFIISNDYLRLKSIQLGYTLPKSLFKSKIEKMRFYVSGFNLFTWDKLKYLDPEMPNVNNGFYPQQKMISGGINLIF